MSDRESRSESNMSRVVGALIEELADEVPDEPRLESVRADLTAASRSYESGKKKDLALRFYLAIRTLLREFEQTGSASRKMDEASSTSGSASRVDLPVHAGMRGPADE